MTATIEEIDLSTFEQLAPPCDFNFRPSVAFPWERGNCGKAADWVVLWKPVLPCCNMIKTNKVTLFADQCWTLLGITGGMCTVCHQISPLGKAVLSVERL